MLLANTVGRVALLPLIEQCDVCRLLQSVPAVGGDVELDPVAVTQRKLAALVTLAELDLHLPKE